MLESPVCFYRLFSATGGTAFTEVHGKPIKIRVFSAVNEERLFPAMKGSARLAVRVPIASTPCGR